MVTALFLAVALAQAEEPLEPSVPGIWTVAMPLGIPQFTLHAPRRGLLFGGIQVLGIGATVYASLEMLELSQSDDPGGDKELAWRQASAASTAIVGLTWLVSGIDGSRAHDEALARSQAMRVSARDWDALVVQLD